MECKDDIKQPTLPTNTTEVMVRVRMCVYSTVSAVFHITSIALVFIQKTQLSTCVSAG